MPKSERRTKVPKSLGLWKIGARESSMFKLEGIMCPPRSLDFIGYILKPLEHYRNCYE